jgi:gamma-glutamyltranspeptidase/glutathione hydrolase
VPEQQIPSAGPWSDSTRYAAGGLVCSVDHLASSAGVAVLRAGGSAADAAIAASAVLAVTTQHMCGAGGDLLAVVHPGSGAPRALLAVGRAGSGSDADRLRSQGHQRMPFRGDIRSVTVPGCVDGWLALHAAHGRLPLTEVLAPAITCAIDGFPASPLLATAMASVAALPGGEDFAVPGATAGTLLRRPRLGAALAAIAVEGREAWYGGAFGLGLLALGDGLFTETDLARNLAEWSDPAAVTIGDLTVLSTPAPTAGYLVLAGAVVADGIGAWSAAVNGDPHLLVEAARVTGYDRPQRLADDVGWESLVDPADLAERAGRIDPDRALELKVPTEAGGTIYLCAADRDGMVVSLSQSNAAGFGAHIAVPEVGVFLQNRGIGFSLTQGHPAELRPGARPTHTLCPSMLIGPGGVPVTALGTMGGDSQPQILLQLMAGLAAGRTPAAVLEQPRWAVTGPRADGFDAWEPWPDGALATTIDLESDAPGEWESALVERGHRVTRAARGRGFGHAHLVRRDAEGLLAGASDPRAGTGDAQGL